MSEPTKTIWAVSRGCYSDYGVLCVCDSKERAEQIAAAWNDDPDTQSYGDPAQVEAFLYLDRDPMRVTTYTMTENIWDDGTTSTPRGLRYQPGDPSGASTDTRVEWEFDMLYPERNRPVSWRWVRAPMHEDKGGRLEVYGTDAERVRKVFSDRRAAYMTDDALRARKEARG